jgi:hypothetical protein
LAEAAHPRSLSRVDVVPRSDRRHTVCT